MSMRPPWIRNAAVLFQISSRTCMLPSMADPTDRALILIVAFGIEAVLAYPAPLFRAIGHPVSWIGALIGAFDARLNRPNYSDTMRRIAGVATVLVLLGISLGTGLALKLVAHAVPYLGFVLMVVVVAMLIAAGNLDQHVRAVASALRS